MINSVLCCMTGALAVGVMGVLEKAKVLEPTSWWLAQDAGVFLTTAILALVLFEVVLDGWLLRPSNGRHR